MYTRMNGGMALHPSSDPGTSSGRQKTAAGGAPQQSGVKNQANGTKELTLTNKQVRTSATARLALYWDPNRSLR
jgi:hypothetical protein